MSDYSNPNIHRGQGISGRGLFIAVIVLVAFVFALAYLGASSVPEGQTGGELGADGVITPAQPLLETPATPADPAPTVVE